MQIKGNYTQNELFIHPELGEVILRLNTRARRLTLSVLPNGTLRVTYPRPASRAQALQMLETKKAWIEEARKRNEELKNSAKEPFSLDELQKMWEAAWEKLPPLVTRLAAEHGFKYKSLKIGTARRKWGSCKGDNSIILSFYLIALPKHLQEFVILHELCHTVHHNHSSAFYALLDEHCRGRERELHAELRRQVLGA